MVSVALSPPQVTPALYARRLLTSLGVPDAAIAVPADNRDPAFLWARSGAMWLSGTHDGAPRPCPAPVAACAQGAWLGLAQLLPDASLHAFQHMLNGVPGDERFEAHQLLGERAAIAGLRRQGRVSPGGACRIFDTADGALALNLARAADLELLPAWLEHDGTIAVDDVPELLATRPLRQLVARARLLGLAAAGVIAPRRRHGWFHAVRVAPPARRPVSVPLVVDLTSLWAGPLCGQLLAASGARVIKVESSARPDGARGGPAAFYDLMNAGKESVALDLRQPAERRRLHALLAQADIVLEAARPRALEQMGIDATQVVAARPGMVWVSITGYGRRAPARDWIAYGDDAGVGAGLTWLMGGDVGDPVFCGDAIADPLMGLHAALAAYAAWRGGGGLLLDLALHRVVAHCIATAAWSVDSTGDSAAGSAQAAARPPVARASRVRAASLGADTDAVLREFT